MPDIVFAYKPLLLLLLIVPGLVIWYVYTYRNHKPSMRYSHTEFLKNAPSSFRLRMMHAPFVLRMLVLVLLIIALARPQSSLSRKDMITEGIDIVIALDISGSMLAEDFRPNRLEAAKRTAVSFIEMRSNDRMGMTVFSGESFTLCPLTTDHALLKELAMSVHTGMVEDGTAIGDGLGTAINRLRESQAISRVIVLLTDGINNAGVIDPLTAAELAASLGIRVYTIGVGSSGPVPYPFQTPFGIQYQQVEIPVDEALLDKMAQITGGRYFWAEDQQTLEAIYREIDQMERSKIDITEYTRKKEEFLPLILLAIGLFMLELLLRYTWLRINP